MVKQKELITYSGSPRTNDNVALLKPQLFIDVIAIDGDTTKQASQLGGLYTTETTIYLEPGEHILTVRYRTGNKISRSTVDMNVSVLAGHRYLVFAQTEGVHWWVGMHGTWRPKVEDMTDNSENWCVNYPHCSK